MIEFIGNINEVVDNTAHLVILNNIKNRTNLLADYNHMLEFPYFGDNWDSLYDCLSDLSWIKNNQIKIVHSSLKELDHSSRLTYIGIIKDVVKEWETDKSKKIWIYFLEEDKNLLDI